MLKKQPSLEAIEKNKDKLNLRPNIEFVSQNIDIFESGLKKIMKIVPTPEAIKWAENIKILAVEEIVLPQLNSEEIRRLLARIPQAIRELSKLKEVTYLLFGNAKVIPVPGYDEFGNFDSSKVELVPINEFPRAGDHPSRILVGVSNGTIIFCTAIPPSISTDERAVWLYQNHVFLHELFHTVDYPRRSRRSRDKILLETDDETFTLQDWWAEFEKLILSGTEPKCVSSYAATYVDRLTRKNFRRKYKKFTSDLAEQICESFVAYMLGIISNDDGWTEFQKESFGNKKHQGLFSQGKIPSANKKWLLVDKLCRAKVLYKD